MRFEKPSNGVPDFPEQVQRVATNLLHGKAGLDVAADADWLGRDSDGQESSSTDSDDGNGKINIKALLAHRTDGKVGDKTEEVGELGKMSLSILEGKPMIPFIHDLSVLKLSDLLSRIVCYQH